MRKRTMKHREQIIKLIITMQTIRSFLLNIFTTSCCFVFVAAIPMLFLVPLFISHLSLWHFFLLSFSFYFIFLALIVRIMLACCCLDLFRFNSYFFIFHCSFFAAVLLFSSYFGRFFIMLFFYYTHFFCCYSSLLVFN